MTNGESNTTHHLAQHFLRHRRWLIYLAAMLLVVSTMFPVIASLTSPAHLPSWVGGLDVTLAFVFTFVMMTVFGLGQRYIDDQTRNASYRIYRSLAHLIILLLVIFFLIGSQIRWEILLPGLAWRLWLFIYVLPAGLALLELRESDNR